MRLLKTATIVLLLCVSRQMLAQDLVSALAKTAGEINIELYHYSSAAENCADKLKGLSAEEVRKKAAAVGDSAGEAFFAVQVIESLRFYDSLSELEDAASKRYRESAIILRPYIDELLKDDGALIKKAYEKNLAVAKFSLKQVATKLDDQQRTNK